MINSVESINLASASPEQLHEQATWSLLSSAVREVVQWDEAIASKLDDLYRVRLVQVLRSRAGEAELAEFSRHLALAAHDLRKDQLNSLSRPYFDRWRAWSDLLATRHRMIATPGWLDAILANRRKAMIVYLVTQAGRVSQEALRNCFQGEFSPPYLTRLLNELEANLLIERVRSAGDARQKDVLPGFDAPGPEAIEPFIDDAARAACMAALAVSRAAVSAANDPNHAPSDGPARQQPGLARYMTRERAPA